MKKPISPELKTRFEFLETLVVARKMVTPEQPVEAVAAALGITPEQLQAVPADGSLSVEFIAEHLGVSHQRVSMICRNAYESIKALHPRLREELRVA